MPPSRPENESESSHNYGIKLSARQLDSSLQANRKQSINRYDDKRHFFEYDKYHDKMIFGDNYHNIVN